MNVSQLKDLVALAQAVVTLLAGLVGALWVWSKYVIERGLIPPSQMDLDLNFIGPGHPAQIVEAVIRISNKGSSALIVTDLRLQLRYLNRDDQITVFDDPREATFGRANFLHSSVLNSVGHMKREPPATHPEDHPEILGRGEFRVIPHNTFVQPGICQSYSFVTALPSTAEYVLAATSFRYGVHPSQVQLAILHLGQMLGILQFSLDDVKKPHTFAKAFEIQPRTESRK